MPFGDDAVDRQSWWEDLNREEIIAGCSRSHGLPGQPRPDRRTGNLKDASMRSIIYTLAQRRTRIAGMALVIVAGSVSTLGSFVDGTVAGAAR